MEEGTIWPCQSNWVLLQLQGWGVRRRSKRRARRLRCAGRQGSIVARCGGGSGCPKSSGLQGLAGVEWFAPVAGSQSHGLDTGFAMFALHERRLVPGRDSLQGSPKASTQDRTRGPPSHMVRSGAAPNSQHPFHGMRLPERVDATLVGALSVVVPTGVQRNVRVGEVVPQI